MFEKLRQLRTERGISAKKMAELLDLETEGAYYKKENGTIKFTLSEGKRVADFFGLPIEAVFFAGELSKTDSLMNRIPL